MSESQGRNSQEVKCEESKTTDRCEILRKLDGLSELSGMRKNIWRIAVALEKLASMEGKDSDKEWILWPKSKRELTKVQGSKEKRKQKEVVTFLWSHTLSELRSCNLFLFDKHCFSCGRKWMWVMINNEARIQVIDDHKGNCRKIQVPKFYNRDCFWIQVLDCNGNYFWIQVSDCNGNCRVEYK